MYLDARRQVVFPTAIDRCSTTGVGKTEKTQLRVWISFRAVKPRRRNSSGRHSHHHLHLTTDKLGSRNSNLRGGGFADLLEMAHAVECFQIDLSDAAHLYVIERQTTDDAHLTGSFFEVSAAKIRSARIDFESEFRAALGLGELHSHVAVVDRFFQGFDCRFRTLAHNDLVIAND